MTSNTNMFHYLGNLILTILYIFELEQNTSKSQYLRIINTLEILPPLQGTFFTILQRAAAFGCIRFCRWTDNGIKGNWLVWLGILSHCSVLLLFYDRVNNWYKYIKLCTSLDSIHFRFMCIKLFDYLSLSFKMCLVSIFFPKIVRFMSLSVWSGLLK